jgi:F-type H+-transporting ATPase subunit a
MFNFYFFLSSPLEQFEILPLYFIPSLNIFINSFVLYFAVSSLLLMFVYYLLSYSKPFRLNALVLVFIYIYKELYNLSYSYVKGSTNYLIGYLFSLGYILLTFNLFGLLPFGQTLTAQLYLPFFFSLVFIITVTYLGFKKHRWHFLYVFLPSGTPKMLLLFIFYIELISYIARIFSLAVRLFANMVAGHTLMFILIGFFYIGLFSNSLFVLGLDIFFYLLIIIISVLEVAIAFIQTFVFILLTIFYFRDCVMPKH